jgi:hypothetical protein
MDIRTKVGSSNYIKAVDLQGKSVTVAILKCAEEVVGQGRQAEDKAVLYFQGRDKGLVLNSTNANTIGEALGWETSNWTGHQIELFPTTTDYQGKIVDCIRIRMPAVARVAAVAQVAAVAPVAAPSAVPPVATAPVAAAPAVAQPEAETITPF